MTAKLGIPPPATKPMRARVAKPLGRHRQTHMQAADRAVKVHVMPKEPRANDFPWAIDEDGLGLLANHLRTTRPDVALEFGSGKSTPILRRYAAHTVSLEHLATWGAKTEELCRVERGRSWRNLFKRSRQTAELRLVEIGSISSPVGPLAVYDTPMPARVDFALIDGPPKSIGRGGVMFQLFPALTAESVVWLDDVNRPEETEILALWQKHFPLQVRPVSDRIAEIRILTG